MNGLGSSSALAYYRVAHQTILWVRKSLKEGSIDLQSRTALCAQIMAPVILLASSYHLRKMGHKKKQEANLKQSKRV